MSGMIVCERSGGGRHSSQQVGGLVSWLCKLLWLSPAAQPIYVISPVYAN